MVKRNKGFRIGDYASTEVDTVIIPERATKPPTNRRRLRQENVERRERRKEHRSGGRENRIPDDHLRHERKIERQRRRNFDRAIDEEERQERERCEKYDKYHFDIDKYSRYHNQLDAGEKARRERFDATISQKIEQEMERRKLWKQRMKGQRRGRGTLRGLGRIYCGYCGKPFRDKSDLLNHQKTCTPPKQPKGFKCKKCGENFKSKEQRKAHRENCPARKKCKFCGQEFGTIREKRKHQRVCRGNPKNIKGNLGDDFVSSGINNFMYDPL